MSETVRAVGFSVLSPEVIVIHYKYNRGERMHVYPPLPELPEDLDLSDTNKRHIVLLRDTSKLQALREHHSSIHRLLVFGNPEDLNRMGVPIIDAVTREGKVVEMLRQLPDVVNQRIEEEAVDIPLASSVKEAALVVDKKAKAPRRRLQWWFDKILAEVDERYHDRIRRLTVKRLMDDISQDLWKKTCKRLTKVGVGKNTAVSFYRWVEGIDGDGIYLGQAVNHYFEAQDREEVNIEAIAQEHKVDADDIRLVVGALAEIEDDE